MHLHEGAVTHSSAINTLSKQRKDKQAQQKTSAEGSMVDDSSVKKVEVNCVGERRFEPG